MMGRPAIRPRSLAIVAGGGALPEIVAAAAQADGIQVFAVRLNGHADADTLAGYDGLWARPERMGAVFAALRARGISDMVLIGRMKRPRLHDLRPDLTTLAILPQLVLPLLFAGDDGLLRAVRRVLEKRGFTLHGADAFAGAMLAQSGVMGRHAPSVDAWRDITLGLTAARAHGLADLGQAVLVREGQVIAREGPDGTDALIAAHGCAGCVLVKAAKPQQDRMLDLPCIGAETVRACAAKGFSGIAAEAARTFVANKKDAIALADAHGLFVVGIT